MKTYNLDKLLDKIEFEKDETIRDMIKTQKPKKLIKFLCDYVENKHKKKLDDKFDKVKV